MKHSSKQTQVINALVLAQYAVCSHSETSATFRIDLLLAKRQLAHTPLADAISLAASQDSSCSKCRFTQNCEPFLLIECIVHRIVAKRYM